MVTDGNQTYWGDHFITCKNNESLYCTPESNIVSQLDFINKQNRNFKAQRILLHTC